MINLSEKLGEMTFDGLITDIKPAPEVRGGVIRKLSAAATLKRGTILAKSSGTAGDGKLVILGSTAKENETLTPERRHRRRYRCRREGGGLHRRLLRHRQGDGLGQLHHHRW